MKVLRSLKNLKLNNPIIALGTFDGVHLGHRRVIENTVKLAKKYNSHSLVITFDPHPQQFIVPERGLRLLTLLSERIDLMSRFEVDFLLVIKFTKGIQKLSYEEFVQKILIRKLKAKLVCVGYDFAFGREREGYITNLKKLSKKYGFKVEIVPPVKIKDEIVKSSNIRKFISRGEIEKANHHFSYPYVLSGRVIAGQGRGRKLGFPTANLAVDPHKLIPAHGVYAGFAYLDGRKYRCVINIGARPTFVDGETVVEVHLLNFNENIKGKCLKVEFFKRLRNEIQFSDVEELKKQIREDRRKVYNLNLTC